MHAIELMRLNLPALQRCKEEQRRKGIDVLITAASSRGEDPDRVFWSIVYDLESAPRTTNRRQFEELGFIAPQLDEVKLFDRASVQSALEQLIDALALMNVYLCRTNHLSDRALLEELVGRVLEEPVPDLPLSVGIRDWIDLSKRYGNAESERDERLPRPS